MPLRFISIVHIRASAAFGVCPGPALPKAWFGNESGVVYSVSLMPHCLKCGAELAVNEEGIAPVLCDRCAGRARSRAESQELSVAMTATPARD